MFLDALDQGPMGGQKGFRRPAHVCVIAKNQDLDSPKYSTTRLVIYYNIDYPNIKFFNIKSEFLRSETRFFTD